MIYLIPLASDLASDQASAATERDNEVLVHTSNLGSMNKNELTAITSGVGSGVGAGVGSGVFGVAVGASYGSIRK